MHLSVYTGINGFFCTVVVMHTSRRAISSSSAAESLVEIDGSGAATKLAREFSISLASISAFSACVGGRNQS